jgi:flagellar motility protein MotE (MotC chaperone)
MLKRLRLLPVVIGIGALVLGVRVVDLTLGGSGLQKGLALGEAKAQQAPARPPANQAAAPAPGAEPDPFGGVAPAAQGGAAAAGAAPLFTRAEVDMLQSLAQRRDQLDARARELDIRENLLAAAEKRIEEKVVGLKEVEARIADLLKKHDEQEAEKLRSLVKVYETMKPKDAARIWDQLDMTILLDVAEMMKEAKLAPILSDMTPERARTVTEEIRTRKQLPKTLAPPAAAAPAAPRPANG